MTAKKNTAKKNTKKITATAPVSRIDGIVSIIDALAFLTNADNVTSTEARAIRSNVCGRESVAAGIMRNLKAAFDAAPDRSSEKANVRVEIRELKSSMDKVRERCADIIDASTTTRHASADANRIKRIDEQRENKRSRFLKIREWLASNDPEWLADNS